MLPNFRMRGNKEVEAMLKDVPYGGKQIVLPAVSEYILGDDNHGLRHYPPVTTQKYVRTFELKAGWHVEGDLYRQRITNSVEYSPYVPRWKKYGWRQWADVVQSNLAGALRHANAKLSAWLKAKGYS